MVISKVKKFIRVHYLAIALGILVGFLMVLPQVLFMFEMGDDYAGVNILATDAEPNFLSRFQEISEGNWGFRDVFWTFNKERSYNRPFLGHVIMYRFGQIFFSDVGQIFLLTKFILPLILFLVIYFFVLLFKPDKRIALLSSVGTMLWYGISSLSELKGFLINNFIVPRYSVFSRPIIPVLGLIILFSFLSFFYLYFSQSQKRYFWLAGILFGLSFYIYFFTWSFLVVFIFISFFWFWFKRDWLRLRKVFGVIFLGALIALPYWFNFYKLINSKIFGSLSDQTGLVVSNSVIIGKYLIGLAILFLIGFYFKKFPKQDLWFWFSLTAGSVVILNQQLITHRVLQPAHYHWYVIKPLTIILLIWFVFSFIQSRYRKYFWLLFIIFISVGFYITTSQQVSIYLNLRDNVRLYSQRYVPVYKWLNENTEKGQLIFSGSVQYVGRLCFLSCYTHLDEYLYKNKSFYHSSFDQNRYILFLEYRLDQITPEMAQDLFFNDLRDEIFYEIYSYYYKITYVDYGKSASDQEVQEILDEYVGLYEQDLEALFKKYSIDYILWDKQLNPKWDLDNFDFLELIYQTDEIRVYKFL